MLSKIRTDGKRVYFIRYMYRGKRITEKVGLKEEKARGRIEARREAMEDPSYIPPPVKKALVAKSAKRRLKFKDFSKVFLREWGSKRKSHKAWFEHMAGQLDKAFGGLYLDRIDQYRIERYLTERRRKVQPATVNHSLRFIKNMLNRAVEWGFLDTNPAQRIKQLREPPPRERFLSQEETDRLIEHAADHLRPIIQTALLTGMRRSEILGLTWDRVHVDRQMIYLESTKSGKPRWVALPDDLCTILKHLPRHVSHDRVFTYRGKPIATLKRSWENARALARLPEARFHGLRHTWASRMVMRGVDLYTLMELGGWSSISMVRRYAHFAPEHKISAAQLLNGTAGQVATLVASQLR